MLGNLFKYEKYDSITAKGMSLLPHIKTFHDTYTFLQKSQWWSRERLEEYQMQQLSKLLHPAYENVPYYRKLFDERGLKPKDIHDFSDLQKLPFLTKEIIRDNLNDLRATNYPQGKLEYVTTGGSTGVPLGLYYERGVSRAQEWAFMKTQWDRVGYRFRDKCAFLKTHVVDSATRGKFWENAFFGRWLVLSSYHMTDDNLPYYIEKIRKFKPRFIQALPSVITILARFMKGHSIDTFTNVEAMLLSSENLYPGQRELLEKVFQCRLYSWYGHAERVVLAGECEKSTYYHVFPEYGIMELIKDDGKPAKREGDVGIIMGTGLTNYAMPLIRYKTDDLGVYTNQKCGCNREYQLLKKVQGRWLQEFIVAKNNRLISSTAMNWSSDIFDNVEQYQFYQEKKGEVIFNIIKKDTYTQRDTEYIRRELLKKLGEDMRLKICFVNQIPRTQSGKYTLLVQKLPMKFGDEES